MTSFVEVPTSEHWRAFRRGKCRVFVAHEAGRWHLSIARADGRYPTWDEIADARYQLLPDDRTFVMILPPSKAYINVANVFHVWESVDDGLPVSEVELGMPRTHEDGSRA